MPDLEMSYRRMDESLPKAYPIAVLNRRSDAAARMWSGLRQQNKGHHQTIKSDGQEARE
jgi:hypothetical protein